MTSELSPSSAFPGALVLPFTPALGAASARPRPSAGPASPVRPAVPEPARAPVRLDLDRFEPRRGPPTLRGVELSGERTPATPHQRESGTVRLGVDVPLGAGGPRLAAGVRATAEPDGAQTQRVDLSVTTPRGTLAGEADVVRGRFAGARARLTVPVLRETTPDGRTVRREAVVEGRAALGPDGRPTSLAAEARYAADGERLRAAVTHSLRERTTRVEVGYGRDLGEGRSIELSGARDLESRATSVRLTFRRQF